MSIFSCEKKIDWKLQSSGNQFLVVESIITNENIYQSVKLSLSLTDINQKPESVSGANVVIFDGENYFTFSEDTLQKGYYFSDQKFIAAINKIYRLSVIFNGETYAAITNVVAVSDFNPVSYNKNTNDSLYYLTNLPSQFSLNENAMYQILIDWSGLSQYSDSSYNQTHQLLYYYSLENIDIPEILAPQTESIYFPKGSIITQRKYSLTYSHAQFIRSLLLETNWRGGVFDLEQGNVTTNLSNGALGFFAACSVIQKQVIVE